MIKTFNPGDRVTVLKSPDPNAPNGGYPEGFVPPVWAGTVVGLAWDLAPSNAVFLALMAEYPDRELADLPGAVVKRAGSSVTVELEGDPAEFTELAARHPHYFVEVDGVDESEGLGHFRPDELEPAS